MEGKILGAEERGVKLEYDLFLRVREEALGRRFAKVFAFHKRNHFRDQVGFHGVGGQRSPVRRSGIRHGQDDAPRLTVSNDIVEDAFRIAGDAPCAPILEIAM